MRQVRIWLAGIVFLTFCTVGQAGEGFVRRDGAKLTLDGREYRAIGMNCPDLFASYAGIFYHLHECFGTPEAARQAMIAAVQEAENHRIAFLRFYASGFWPKDMRLYFDAPEQYWARMDELLSLCRKHHIRLVPSIFFHIYLWPLICGEDYRAIADPNSKTYRAMHNYATELVSRYKDDTNILAWELSNEMFLAADVNMAGRDAPGSGVMLSPTTKTKLTLNESLTTATILKFYGDMTAHIRRIDPNHLVTSGDAGPRITSVSLRENFPTAVWKQDTLRQNLASLLSSQPEPLDLVSLHHYGSLTKNDEQENLGLVSSLDALRRRIRCVHAARSPVFVGELGNTEPTLRDDREAGYVRAVICMIEAEGASLAAVWAWHLRLDPIHNVIAQSHPALMKRIAEFNAKYATIGARP
jgi:mannan endo-1,4-beta-mannosidase